MHFRASRASLAALISTALILGSSSAAVQAARPTPAPRVATATSSGAAQFTSTAARRPTAKLIYHASQGSDSTIVADFASDAKRIQVRYQVRKRVKGRAKLVTKRTTLKVRKGIASYRFPPGAQKPQARAVRTARLRASRWTKVVASPVPTVVPIEPAPGPAPTGQGTPTTAAPTSTDPGPATTPTSIPSETPPATGPPAYIVGDIDRDGVVGCADLAILQGDWNTSNARSDLNGDGLVTVLDLSMLLSHWTAGSGTCDPQTPEDVAVASLEQLPPATTVAATGSALLPNGQTAVAVQYSHAGVPVLGAQAVVSVSGSTATSTNEQPPPEMSVDTTPTVTAEQASTLAITRVGDELPTGTEGVTAGSAELVILEPIRMGLEYPAQPVLVWWLVVTAPAESYDVAIDAHDGAALWLSARSLPAYDLCDAGNTQGELPCTAPDRTETSPATGQDDMQRAAERITAAHDYFQDTFGTDSFQSGSGGRVRVTINSSLYQNNAFWAPDAAGGFLGFSPGMANADDVVGHEYTHGVMGNRAAGQFLRTAESGGISEGLSDVFGNLIDLSYAGASNDTDTEAARWQYGEDSPGGVDRFMDHPENNRALPRAAREVGDANWQSTSTSGAPYANLGVVDRLAYLLMAGEGNVTRIGEVKAARIIYQAAQMLTSNPTMAEFGGQLVAQCQSLIGSHAITAADCSSVEQALFAVAIRADVPTHPKSGTEYIVRNPVTGRAVLIRGGQAWLIESEDYACLAHTRVVWDAAMFVPRGLAGVQLNCYDSGPQWTYSADSQGGNTGTNIIIREPSGSAWFIDAVGVRHQIRTGQTYLCLARSYPVIWGFPTDRVQAWPNTSDTAATCGNAATLDCSEVTVVPNDDQSSAEIALPFQLKFGSRAFASLWVNNNGNVTFDGAMSTFTPFPFVGSSRAVIAPYFADVDTRAAGSGLATAGATAYQGRRAFCVNWDHVGYYPSQVDKTNSFQLVLVDRSDIAAGDFDIVFNYTQVQWETGSASGGSGGMGGTSAGVGYSNGVGLAQELPGSRVPGTFLDTGTRPLVRGTNSGTVGRYVWEIRQ